MAREPDITYVGHDLHRPECVLTCASGRLYMSDARGGVTTIAPDGAQRLIGKSDLTPNGIALCRDGSFLIANLGKGGVWRIDAQGEARPYLTDVDGQTLPGVNFVGLDMQERIWASVSAHDTGETYPIDARTGFIILIDKSGTRIVGDGLQYTNECRVDPTGKYLFVNETFGRRVTRFRIAADGSLHDRETYAEFFAADFPDGLTLDAEGGVWVMCVGSNRVYRVDAQRNIETVIDDSAPETVDKLEAAYQSRTLRRPDLGASKGARIANVTSLAFGGPDLRTAYLGSLKGTQLASFRSPVAGLPPLHWNWS
ncbi:MAG: SMP-30/gluconolactonase/LRE family protein [Casimicrobiaceae bacterium]